MVYVAGIFGFIGGFVIGQVLLLKLLKDRSKEEIMENKQIHWTYGLLNWIIAAISAYVMVFLYQYHFTS